MSFTGKRPRAPTRARATAGSRHGPTPRTRRSRRTEQRGEKRQDVPRIEQQVLEPLRRERRQRHRHVADDDAVPACEEAGRAERGEAEEPADDLLAHRRDDKQPDAGADAPLAHDLVHEQEEDATDEDLYEDQRFRRRTSMPSACPTAGSAGRNSPVNTIGAAVSAVTMTTSSFWRPCTGPDRAGRRYRAPAGSHHPTAGGRWTP